MPCVIDAPSSHLLCLSARPLFAAQKTQLFSQYVLGYLLALSAASLRTLALGERAAFVSAAPSVLPLYTVVFALCTLPGTSALLQWWPVRAVIVAANAVSRVKG